MPWAKVHTDILSDAKLIRAARTGAKGLAWLPWLIVFAKEANDNGRLSVGPHPAEPIDIAPLLPGAKTSEIRACFVSLERLGVLVRDADHVLRFASWNARQDKPSDARDAVRERVQHHRERKRAVAHDLAGPNGALSPARPSDVTPSDVTPCNALQVTPGNATEVEEKQKQKRTETPTPALARESVVAAAVDGPLLLIVAANQGMRDNPAMATDADTAPAISHSHGTSVQAAVDLLRDVNPDFARAVIYEAARDYVPKSPRDRIRSLGYFAELVRRRWAEKHAADAASAADRPVLIGAGVSSANGNGVGRPSPRSFKQQEADAEAEAGARKRRQQAVSAYRATAEAIEGDWWPRIEAEARDAGTAVWEYAFSQLPEHRK